MLTATSWGPQGTEPWRPTAATTSVVTLLWFLSLFCLFSDSLTIVSWDHLPHKLPALSFEEHTKAGFFVLLSYRLCFPS